DISTLNNSAKKVINYMVELIENTYKFLWIYYQSYSERNMTMYQYFCLQSDDLVAKSRKHQDISKYYNTKAMGRFGCNR
ncbi:4607_t:CDS:2, partial [Funneliformis geosporum]